MATQYTNSKPLFDESEEEKRKREAARNYLGSLAKGREDAASREAALNEGIGGPTMAQDVLSKPQARIVGDTLVGSAAGISAGQWEEAKTNPSTLAGNPSLQKSDMLEIAPGIKGDYDTAQRATANMRAQAESDKAAQPDYAKANAALSKRLETQREREKASVARGKDFFNRIAERDELNKLADQDIAIAKQEYSNARRVEGAMRTALNRYRATNGREGQLVTAEQMGRAQNMLANARLGLGPTDNVDERRSYFQNRIASGQRVNPWDNSQVASSTQKPVQKPSSQPSQTTTASDSNSTPAFSFDADPKTFSSLQTEDEKKRRRSLFPSSPLGTLG